MKDNPVVYVILETTECEVADVIVEPGHAEQVKKNLEQAFSRKHFVIKKVQTR